MQTPETSSVQPIPDLSTHNWGASTPCPWDSNLFFFSLSPDDLQAALVILTQREAADLEFVLRHFINLSAYCGFRDTLARLSSMFNKGGDDMPLAWGKASISLQIILQGMGEFVPNYCSAFLSQRQEEHVRIPMSRMHAWAIHQCMGFMIEELLPAATKAGGPAWGVDPADLKTKAEAARAFFETMRSHFDGDNNPFASLVDLVSIDKMPKDGANG
jgi:hypothetical protein